MEGGEQLAGKEGGEGGRGREGFYLAPNTPNPNGYLPIGLYPPFVPKVSECHPSTLLHVFFYHLLSLIIISLFISFSSYLSLLEDRKKFMNRNR